ncbi:Vacuolar transporter chaperone 4 [Auxenochlorella protothecoides]|uniref:Vacuolar transporter chaperone 4 n=1 Tax=Auxenochlorella protothecoides TaxID=3075 RepID=A0A087SCV5_AUXPR|nr:Vacuolar transporter chaperone 4 [Auxenochlorella protothecoides]KFM23559.1 Vacuolar transporter chaperone 4 [Auxenochlorella protothecoides]
MSRGPLWAIAPAQSFTPGRNAYIPIVSGVPPPRLPPGVSASSGFRTVVRVAAPSLFMGIPSCLIPPIPQYESSYLRFTGLRLRCLVATEGDALWNRVLDAIAALQTTVGLPAEQARRAAEALQATQRRLEAAGEAYVALTAFVRHNVAACAKLAAAYDHLADLVTGAEGSLESGTRLYLACLQQCVVGHGGLEAILVALSDAWELLRHCRAHNAALTAYPSGRWVAPQKFTRVTRKFWMRACDAPAFKAEVIKHLPVLIYGDRAKFTEGDVEARRCLAGAAHVADAAAVTSVYFDNPEELPVYHARLRRADGATAVRLRWYGERAAASPDQEIFVEEKVHRESWTDHFSSKERARLVQGEVAAFLAGQDVGGSRPAEDAALLARVQAFLAREAQGPFLRTTYQRTAFQASDSAAVRISMDSDLRMIREAGAPRARDDWCRDLTRPLAPADIVNFSFVVVEVKLQRKAPEWLTPLLKSGKLLAVPKFSKHIHGTAVLFQLLTENVPHWFLPDAANPSLMTPATWHELADKSDALLRDAASWLFPSADGGRRRDADPDPDLAPKASLLRRLARRNRTAPVLLQPGVKEARAVEEAGHADAAEHDILSGSAAHARMPTWPVFAAGEALPPPPTCAGPGDGAAHPTRTPTPPPSAFTGPSSTPQPSVYPVSQLVAVPMMLTPRSYHGNSGGREDNGAGALQRHSSSSEQGPGNGKAKNTGSSTPEDSARDLEAGRALLGSAGDLKVLGGQDAVTLAATRSGRVQALVRTRVEPKTFFANERTFLAWLQISVLVMLTALSLLSGSSISVPGAGSASGGSEASCTDGRCFASKVSGAIIAPVAVLFMAYALYMYKKRTIQIMRRETVRYDDQRGPVALVIILILVTLISYIISLVYGF